MNKRTILIGTSVLVAAVAIRAIYKNIILAGQWDFKMGKFRVNSFSPLSVTQTIEFINQSNLKVTVRNVDVTALTNGVRIGTIKDPKEQTIAGKGIYPFDITYVLNPNLGEKKVQDAITQAVESYIKTKDIPVDFVGTIDVKTPFGFTSIPIRYSSTGKNLYQLWYDYYTSA